MVSQRRVKTYQIPGEAPAIPGGPTGPEWTAAAGALTAGDAGDIKATVGVTITNVKPGRIDARVRGLSTADSDTSTLLNTLIAESGTDGSELWIPDGTYRGHMGSIPSNARINGTGTIKAKASSPGQYVLSVLSGATRSNITIEGITIDGNATSSGIGLSTNFPDGVTGATVRNVTIENTGSGDYGYGIVMNPATHVVIEGCTIDAANPIVAFNPEYLTVRGNTILYARTLNAVDVQIYGTHICRGLVVRDNRLLNCYRMGVEIVVQGGGTGYYEAPVIEGNTIHIQDTHDGEAYGISLNVAPGARIETNTILYDGGGTLATYGIELVASPGSMVGRNAIHNMQYGITMNTSSRSTVSGNSTFACWNGIESAGAQSSMLTIEGNTITDPRDTGMIIRGASTTTHGGHIIEGNVIYRSLAWSGDASRVFGGIRIEKQQFPSQLARNRLVLAEAVPTSGLVWHGILADVGSGGLDDSVVERNVFVDLATSPYMTYPIACTAGGAAVAGVTLPADSNLKVLADGTVSSVNAWP